ncbi:RagB/SusD family nutrient uptake outer membrane protein [Pedobacter sp. MC2016-24]|uniref:RagB/SusD family nutrient uptake outer membrane protein n=1 Tax=Pedobacter sp. MC2016-24 TaxID=2780090 RepID=UPI0018800C70|nr:RagB/SusD family nutrient uptake outer membrane protein [Pedobacter sp. MC2016-24]MBE9601927.1 RagB/SusD family nutrient uptake outer membrane protein [Pedobacter sp. MC2016-24]
MNKIIYIILAAALMMQSSCKKILEKELPEHELAAEVAIVDEKSATVALNGAYSYLQYNFTPPLYTAISPTFTTGFSYDYAVNGAQMAGLLKGGQRFTFDVSLSTFSVVSSDNIIPGFYRLVYRIVNAANNVIFYTEKLPADKIGSEKRAEIIAEAKFLRAFGHLWALKYHGYFWDNESPYGPVLRLAPTSINNLLTSRATVKATYESILADYQYCIENGPKTHTSVYRTCRSTAKAFKAEALIMRGLATDFSEALKLANEVISGTEFKMETSFADVFLPANDYLPNRELLFSRFINAQTIASTVANPLAQSPYGVFSYAVGNIASVYSESENTYYSTLIRADARYPYTWAEDSFTSGNPPVTKTGVSFRKVFRFNGNCPSYIMRLAQLYLIKAEALAKTGASATDVLAPLNFLRTRSGNTLLNASDYVSKARQFEAIVNEYVLELGVENASEWFAMARLKDEAGNRFVARFNPSFLSDWQLCLPIPQDEVAANKGVVIQNPNY